MSNFFMVGSKCSEHSKKLETLSEKKSEALSNQLDTCIESNTDR